MQPLLVNQFRVSNCGFHRWSVSAQFLHGSWSTSWGGFPFPLRCWCCRCPFDLQSSLLARILLGQPLPASSPISHCIFIFLIFSADNVQFVVHFPLPLPLFLYHTVFECFADLLSMLLLLLFLIIMMMLCQRTPIKSLHFEKRVAYASDGTSFPLMMAWSGH